MSYRSLWLSLVLLVLPVAPVFGQSGNVGANFTSATEGAIAPVAGALSVPPDTTGAVGPNHYIQYNNGGLVIYNKAGGTTTALMSETAFWQNKAGLSSAIATLASGDPRVVFDQLSGRWVVIAFTGSPTNNRLLIARSDTTDPNGTWKGTSIAAASGQFADFPTLGVDRNGVTLAVNNFGGGTFTGVYVYSIPKADLYAATPSLTNMTTLVNTSTGFASQGVNNFNTNQTGASAGALVSSNFTNAIRYTPINGSGAAGATLGTATTLSVSSFGAPPNIQAPNAGNNGLSTRFIDTGDTRTMSTVYRVGNFLYMARHASLNGGTQSGIRVTVLNLSGATPTVAAEATLGGTSDPNFNSYYPSVAANANGDVVVGYSRSGFIGSGNAANRWIGSYASVGKFNGTNALTFSSTPIELFAGERDYTSFEGTGSANPNRWGDYSATTLDPADPGVFWTTQEYAAKTADGSGSGSGFTNWATRATEVIPTVAGEVRWRTAAAGTFGTAANWFNATSPGAADHVIFSRWSASNYTVSVAGGATNDRLSVRQTGTGTLTFNIPTGSTWSLTNSSSSTPSFVVSEFQGTSNVTITGGGVLSTQYAQIAPAAFGTGTVTVDGATWTNAFDLSIGGTAAGGAGGTGTLNVRNGGAVAVGGTLGIYQGDGTTVQVSVGNATAAGSLSAAGLTGGAGVTPRIDLGHAGSTLTVTNGLGTTFGGGVTGSGSVAKQGAGTLTLTGANTYTGATTVAGTGTLALSGSGSIAGSKTVTVGTGSTLGVSGVTGGANFDPTSAQFALASGQTLQGTGTVNGGVTVRPGASIRGDSGTGTGTLTVAGALVLQGAAAGGGATLNSVVSDNGTGTPDHSTVGAATVNLAIDTTNKFNLVLAQGAAYLPQGVQYLDVLATTTGGIRLNGGSPLSPNTTIDPVTYTLTGQGGLILGPVYQLAVDGTGTVLLLSFTPVPEPATVLGVAAGVLGVAGLVRRRRRVA